MNIGSQRYAVCQFICVYSRLSQSKTQKLLPVFPDFSFGKFAEIRLSCAHAKLPNLIITFGN